MNIALAECLFDAGVSVPANAAVIHRLASIPDLTSRLQYEKLLDDRRWTGHILGKL